MQVRHCFLHHNQRLRLGYGVYLDQADALLEANLFDWYRHCVAGSGRPGTSYEARYNYVLPNASGHAFDMHGGADRNDGTDIAGDHIKIHRNIVEAAQFPAVVVRGRPRVGLEISENQFRNPDPARTLVLQAGEESATVVGNKFGVSSMRAPDRTSRGSPIRSRSRCRAWLVAGCDSPIRIAARLTLASLSSASSATSRLRSSEFKFI